MILGEIWYMMTNRHRSSTILTQRFWDFIMQDYCFDADILEHLIVIVTNAISIERKKNKDWTTVYILFLIIESSLILLTVVGIAVIIVIVQNQTFRKRYSTMQSWWILFVLLKAIIVLSKVKTVHWYLCVPILSLSKQ